jgi:hypothetical protein
LATVDEIAARFGHDSELRRVQMESVKWLIDVARRAGVSRVGVNGNFVTDKVEPNDVDCVLLVESGFPRDSAAEADLTTGLPPKSFTSLATPPRRVSFLCSRGGLLPL